MLKKYPVILCCLLFAVKNNAQKMQPGFDPAEYHDVLELGFKYIGDSLLSTNNFTLKKGQYNRLMRSPEVGLMNRVEVYLRSDSVAVVNLRGTINKPVSWLANVYAAMVPATGSLHLNDSTIFNYKLAELPSASVHAGWLVSVGSMAPYIEQQLETLLKRGITNILVVGHSQGGALAILTTSYIYYKYHALYPAMQLKTYGSAAPKPGNLYYAYDFDHITRDGYGYRIVNSADWVPETPLSSQTSRDFNAVNPITDAKKLFKQQKFFVRLALNHIYNKMKKGSDLATRRYEKYLGHKLYGMVKKTLPQFKEPEYAKTSNYMTAGSPIILMADAQYYEQFPFDGKNVFVNHMYAPYEYLLRQYYPAAK